jgi:hypothetical protein
MIAIGEYHFVCSIDTTQENGVLTLTNIQQSHAGTYTCTGTTSTGIVGRATSRITVTGTVCKFQLFSIERAFNIYILQFQGN